MKKTAFIVSVVLVITAVALLLGAAANTRKLDADYELDFNRTTAICTAVVTGEHKDDFIQVTMRLKQENVIWKTWNQEGYFQVALEETCEGLIKNKVYTLEISATINGKPQPVLSTSKVCSGREVTRPTTAPTVPTTPTTQPTVPPTTQPTVPPTTQPTVPPTTQPTVPPTTPPTTQPTELQITVNSTPSGNYLINYTEAQYSFPNDISPNLSGCTVGFLYWVDGTTGEVVLVADERVICQTFFLKNADSYDVYYVKEAEPTRIYRTAVGDFSKHELFYETTQGNISYVGRSRYSTQYLGMVIENKKFSVMDFTTGQETIWMEQYYIEYAQTLNGLVYFYGKHTETDVWNELYVYSPSTGETELQDDDDCDCEECV